MTLILGVIKKNFIVVASDGAGFKRDPGQLPYIIELDRQKIHPLPHRGIAFGVYGNDKVTSSDFESQRYVGEVILKYEAELVNLSSVKDIASYLLEKLTPLVNHTGLKLYERSIAEIRTAIVIYGFDIGNGNPQCYLVYWKGLNVDQVGDSECLYNGNKPYLIRSGDNNATDLIDKIIQPQGSRFNKSRITGLNLEGVKQYISGLYTLAKSRQPTDSTSFDGNCQVLVIGRNDCEWVSPK